MHHPWQALAATVLSAAFCTSLANAQSARQRWLAPIHRMMPSGENLGTAVAIGDLSGDGWEDAVIALGSQRLLLRIGTGRGSMLDASAALSNVASISVRTLAAGDLDGDGDLDLLLGPAHGRPQLVWNLGQGRFTAGALLPGAESPTLSLALGDIDGDADLDVFAGNATNCGFSGCSFPNRLYRNDGAGAFTEVTSQIPLQNGHTNAAAFGDLDADGDLDLVLAQSNPQFTGEVAYNRLWRNDGTGRFADHATAVSVVPRRSTSLLLADFDRDGDLDLWFGNRHDSNSSRGALFLNDGAANFTDASAGLPNDPYEVVALASADVDRDLDLDVVWVDVHGAYGMYRNDGSARFTGVAIFDPLVDRAHVAAFARLSSDGDADLILGSSFALLSDGRGHFLEGSARLAREERPTHDAALADLNGDGLLDAYLARDGRDEVLISIGAGYFVGSGQTLLPPNDTVSLDVALGDVDGDGDIDAYVAEQRLGGLPYPDHLYLNDGTGRFSDASSRLPTGALATAVVELFDADADGDLDAFFGTSLAGTVGVHGILRNDGTGRFAELPLAVPALAGQTEDVAVGDVDADGDLDLMLAQSLLLFPSDNVLLLNGGQGSFQIAGSALPQFAERSRSVDLGDVDGDGDLDALFSGTLAHELRRLYLNSGGGTFSYTGQYLGQGFTPEAALRDLDGDGDLEAIFATPSTCEIYENLGGGILQLASPQAFLATARAIAFGDVDVDGDLDALVVGDGALLCANLERHLAWREIPRLGKPLFLELQGAPLSNALLLLGLGRASISLPPYGTLHLDPARLLASFPVVFDSRGEATWGSNIPPDPTLIGAIAHSQALFLGPPLRLGNLEHLVITRF